MTPTALHRSTAMSVLALAVALALPALAEETQAHRAHGAHVHGVGSLHLVMDGAAVEIELESPAANLVGFEHAPKNDADRAALDRAVVTLKDGSRLFDFPASAGCRLAESSVNASLLAEEPSPEEARQAPTHDHGDEDEAHGDLDADYRFVCAHPEALHRIEVRLFERFPTTQRLRVQYATEKEQGALELTPANPRIDL